MLHGIEKYVTPIEENDTGKTTEYLSRSKEYYNVKSMTELSKEREELKRFLDRKISKRNFVILENMLNCSGKVYFKKLQKYIMTKTSEDKNEMEIARKCMEEDVKNILVILSKNGIISVNQELILPGGNENSEKRIIEMDNKAILYAFCKSLNFSKQNNAIEILTPGYGSIYIGPFLQQMYGCSYTNLLKSNYIQDTTPESRKLPLRELISDDTILNNNKKILILDDNIGTGKTIEEIKNDLNEEGIDSSKIKTGAVQYNWINYYRISVGDKRIDKYGNKINRFEVKDYDILSPINYVGHKLAEVAIDRLHSSGNEYIEYLKDKSYRIPGYNDVIGAIERGIQYAKMSGVNLTSMYDFSPRKQRNVQELIPEYKNKVVEMNDVEIKTINNIIKVVNSLSEDKDVFKERSQD